MKYLELYTDIVDTTPADAPPGTHRTSAAGARHALLRVPVPVWIAEIYLTVWCWRHGYGSTI